MTVQARPHHGPDGTAETRPGVQVVRIGARERIPALGYQPPLDGLRAVAVLAVLCYHARFPWAEGGFLGVSTFFTLSGFLITALLLRERAGAASVDLRRFWSRRFRRLLPASWASIALILLLGAAGAWTEPQLRDLRSDVPFALLEIINWHFIAQGRTYGADFVAPSPLEHFWSLAVEQQFYLVFPVLLTVLLAAGTRTVTRSGGGGTRRMGTGPAVVVLALLGVGSAWLNGHWADTEPMRAYFGTTSRLFELVAGALLACAVLRRPAARSTAVRGGLDAVGLVGLGVSVWLFATASLGTRWLYPWGFLLLAACTVAVVLGSLQGGWLGRILSVAPLVGLGRISYGVYLLHWPVFLWLGPSRVPWPAWPLFALRMAVTLVAAVAMFRLLERPVRVGRVRTRTFALTIPVAAAVLVAATMALTSDLPGPTALERASAAAGDGPARVRAAEPPPPTRVLVLGDELAEGSDGIEAGDGSARLRVATASVANCGLALGGWVRLADGAVERDVDRCGAVRDAWAARLAAERPEVVVLWAGLRDVADRRFDPESPWRAPGDPVLDDFLRTEVGAVIDLAGSTGARVVVLTAPHVRSTRPAPPAVAAVPPPDPERARLAAIEAALVATGVPPAGHAENQDLRIDAWNQVLGQAAAARGVPVIDVAARMRSWPGGEFDPDRRAGGVGLTGRGARDVLGWLAPVLRTAPVPAPPGPPAGLEPDAPLPPAPAPAPRRVVAADRPVNVLVVGDSVAFNLGYGLLEVGRASGDLRAANAAQFGCPVARGGSYRFLRDVREFPARCDWAQLFPRFLAEQNPDLVVLASGIWEVVDRRFVGDDRWRHIGMPEVDRYLLREFLAAVDTLGSTGATVALVTYPRIEAGADRGFVGLPESDPARIERLNQLLAQVVALRPGVATLVDLRGWLAGQPGGESDPAARPDGVHFSDDYSVTVARWLAPVLGDLARRET